MTPRPPSLAAGALALFVLVAHAQDNALDRVPPDGQVWRIDRTADSPPQLLAAMKQADCRQDDAMLFAFPIELFRPIAGSRAMAIAPCRGVLLYGRAFVFDGEARGEARPLAFPVMAFPGKVSASETPGLFTWNPQARTLTAVQGSDVCDGTTTRHTYRHDRRHDGDDLNGFALVKLERGRLGCDVRDTWQVIWDADAPR